MPTNSRDPKSKTKMNTITHVHGRREQRFIRPLRSNRRLSIHSLGYGSY